MAKLIGGGATAQYIGRYESSDPQHAPSHFEIWFEAPPKPAARALPPFPKAARPGFGPQKLGGAVR